MAEKATTSHSLGERYRNGGEHHDPKCDPGVLTGGVSLKLRGQPVWYHLSSVSSGSLSCPLPAPLAPYAETTKWYLGIKRKLGKLRFYCLGVGEHFKLFSIHHLI